MKCSKIQQLLSNYLDGSVSENEKYVVEEHLKTCISCQKEFEMLQKLGASLDLVCNVQVPLRFEDLILNEIAETEIPTRSKLPFILRLPKWIYASATIVTIIITILFGNLMGKTMFREYVKRRTKIESPTISIYQFGICFEVPDSSFSVMYLNLKM